MGQFEAFQMKGIKNRDKKLVKKHFTEIENIYPPIRENMEVQIACSMEVLVKADGLYFFSPHFKLSQEIFDAVLKKYGYNPEENLFSEPLAMIKQKNAKVYIIKTAEKKLLCYENPTKISHFSVEKYYPTKYGMVAIDPGDGTCDIRFSETAALQDGKVVQYNGEKSLKEITSSPCIRNLLHELILLHENAKINIDAHPYRKMDQDFKKTYIGVLLYMSCFNQELSANQVLRVEEIARQFNVSSIWLKEKLVTECLKSENRNRIGKIKSFIKSMDLPDKRVLLIDMLSLDILRRKYGSGKDRLLRNIDKLLKIRYSEAVQIKLHLEKIL